MTRRGLLPPAGLLPLVGLLLVTGCGGSPRAGGPDPATPSGQVSGVPGPTGPTRTSAGSPAPSSPRACPPLPAGSGGRWPAGIPADLPRPPGIRDQRLQPASAGVAVVRFTTPLSLPDSIRFVLRALPAAGYALGRGDAERSEADAPFARPGTRGVIRMVATAPCLTTWVVAAVQQGALGVLPTFSPSPSPSASALPFG